MFVLSLLCSCYHCEAAAPKCDAWAQPELNPKPGAKSQVPQSEVASLKPTQEKKKCCCKPASLGAVCYTAPLQQKLTITMSARCLCLKNSLFTGVQCLYTVVPTFTITSTLQKVFYEMQRDWLTMSLLIEGSVGLSDDHAHNGRGLRQK